MTDNTFSSEIKHKIIQELHDKGCSCIIYNGAHSCCYHNPGVKDLYTVLTDAPELLRNAFVADKVVGKGAAALMCAGNVAEVYADVISEPALDLFKFCGVVTSYGVCVPNIINRKGTGVCPVEKLCIPLGSDVASCVAEIRNFIN